MDSEGTNRKWAAAVPAFDLYAMYMQPMVPSSPSITVSIIVVWNGWAINSEIDGDVYWPCAHAQTRSIELPHARIQLSWARSFVRQQKGNDEK